MEAYGRYIVNGFTLTIPILVWNIVLGNSLPVVFHSDAFQSGIPLLIVYGEHIFRILFFVLIFMMPLKRKNLFEKRRAVLLYLFGVLAYFASWLILICLPESMWSNSLIGFTAPAWTPVFWMFGIVQLGDSFSFNIPFRKGFILMICFVFLLFHITHTYMLYLQANL